MPFSRRLGWPQPRSRLGRLLAERLAAGATLHDLTVSNPTRVGLEYPAEAIRAALADPRVLGYDPVARGPLAARQAVAADHARRGVRVEPDDVVLCASTSEAYGWLFKLLCDPGDAVLAPRPSYPLFEYLAGLEGVTLVPYDLADDAAWRLDAAALERLLAATPRARVVLVVSPNNPTGAILRREDHARLDAACARAGLAVVCDEVFADYRLEAHPGREPVACAAAAAGEALTFSLGGLSKSAGLPQLKLGWIVAGGPRPLRAEALDRLELIADSYLSASAPALVAAPRLLGEEIAGRVRQQIQARVRANHAWLAERLRPAPHVELLPAEAGWTAVLRLPATISDEDLAARLLERDGVVVHPGYFYDFPPRRTYVVLSLLVEPAPLRAGLEALLGAL